MVIANDNEQQTAATEFIRNKLHISISPDDLEAAHPIPNTPATSSTAEATQTSNQQLLSVFGVASYEMNYCEIEEY